MVFCADADALVFLMAPRGATPNVDGTRFSVWSGTAERIWVCLFDAQDRETDRIELARDPDGLFYGEVAGVGAGQRYGFRADGRYDPADGFWYDPDKLLMDPYAVEIDRPYRLDPLLCAPRGQGRDTAPLMPRAIVAPSRAPLEKRPPLFRNGGLIYEASVRALTMRHPDVPQAQRGTVAALAHPAIVAHLQKIGVSAIELMPVTAWIDERHLPPLGLSNAWGYNPVSFMALEPRLCPGGVEELRSTTEALRQAGIGVILDLVFNHTGESDVLGPTLCFRGLDNLAYYRHLADDPVVLANDTGCGNTIATQHLEVHRLILDSLRHFVEQCGVDGFRFDLAPVLGRDHHGFDPAALFFREIADDAVLSDRVLIAEPWDIGPGGYHLGNFPSHFLEWNDVYRDDVRRFWRGDGAMVPALATRLAGSSDVFTRNGNRRTRTVNFIAAHDGVSLADITAFEHRHNLANGEDNRDGHGENLSWNNGIEGETTDAAILAARTRDLRALLATLFVSRGTIMLTAGDEFGRTQRGNNNAYAQDNEITWLDWSGRDRETEDFVALLSALRRGHAALRQTAFLSGAAEGSSLPDVSWLAESGGAMTQAEWHDAQRRRLTMILAGLDGAPPLAAAINGDRRATVFALPQDEALAWRPAAASGIEQVRDLGEARWLLPGRTVTIFMGESL